MATTTNYGWVTPDDTALVKDGAAAIRTLGTSADTTVYNNDLAAIKKAIVDAKGDIIAATAADTVARLAVGATNGMVLTVDSAEATGLKYALPAGGSLTSLASGSLSGTSLNLTSIAATYNDLRLELKGISVSASASLGLTINGTTFNYQALTGDGSAALTNPYNIAGANQLSSTATNGFLLLQFYDYANTTSLKKMSDMFVFKDTGATNFYLGETSGAANTTAAINQITVTVSGGNSFDAGTYVLYGVK